MTLHLTQSSMSLLLIPHTKALPFSSSAASDVYKSQRPIIAVCIYSAKKGKYYHMPTTILGSYNHEILPKPPNARDMIIKKGDIININMQDKTVTINEEPALDQKTFGSDFFNIEKGVTECIVEPAETFDSTCYWQDRYL